MKFVTWSRIFRWFFFVMLGGFGLLFTWMRAQQYHTMPLAAFSWRLFFPFDAWWSVMLMTCGLLLGMRLFLSGFRCPPRHSRRQAWFAGWATTLIVLALATPFFLGPISFGRFFMSVFLLGFAIGEATLNYVSWEDCVTRGGYLATGLAAPFMFWGAGLFEIASLALWFYSHLVVTYLMSRLKRH